MLETYQNIVNALEDHEQSEHVLAEHQKGSDAISISKQKLEWDRQFRRAQEPRAAAKQARQSAILAIHKEFETECREAQEKENERRRERDARKLKS